MPIEKKRRVESSIPFITKKSEYLLSEKEACETFGLTMWTNSIIPFNGDQEDPEITALMNNSIVESKELQLKMAIEETEMNGHKIYGLMAIDTINQGESIVYGAKQHTFEEASNTTDDFYKIVMNQDTIISAKDFGNMARFMNHAPEKDDVSKILRLSKKNMATLATANFTSRLIRIGDLEYTVLTALRKINPGERLYWDYGLEYFENLDTSIALFNRQGKQVNPKRYRWLNQRLQFKLNGELVAFDNLEEILKNDGLAEAAVTDHNPPFYISVHARYIRESLEIAPDLADNYYVNIPTPDLEHPFVKIFNVDDQRTNNIMKQYILDELTPEEVNQQQMKLTLNKYQDLDRSNSPFASTYLSIFEVKVPSPYITLQIKNACELLGIECHINEVDSRIAYIASADIFANIVPMPIEDVQQPDPLNTPDRKVSFLQPQLNLGQDNEVDEVAQHLQLN